MADPENQDPDKGASLQIELGETEPAKFVDSEFKKHQGWELSAIYGSGLEF